MNWKRTRSCSPIKTTLLIETNRRGRPKKKSRKVIGVSGLIKQKRVRLAITKADVPIRKIIVEPIKTSELKDTAFTKLK